eukprot:scaffold78034_cov23-Tisochrysis_lutea.AAC.3
MATASSIFSRAVASASWTASRRCIACSSCSACARWRTVNERKEHGGEHTRTRRGLWAVREGLGGEGQKGVAVGGWQEGRGVCGELVATKGRGALERVVVRSERAVRANNSCMGRESMPAAACH